MPASSKFQFEEPKIGTRFAQHFENPYNINAVSSLQVKTLEVPEHEILRQKKSSQEQDQNIQKALSVLMSQLS